MAEPRKRTRPTPRPITVDVEKVETLAEQHPDLFKDGPGMVIADIADAKLSPLIEADTAAPAGRAGPTREPSESLTEITGAIAGLAEYIEARDAMLGEQLAVIEARTKAQPVSKEAHATRATAYRAAAVVMSIAVVAAAVVIALYLLADAGVL